MGFHDFMAELEANISQTGMLSEMNRTDMFDSKTYEMFELCGELRMAKACEMSEMSEIELITNSVEPQKYHFKTNKKVEYFQELIGESVYISGITKRQGMEMCLWVSACYGIKGREDALEKSNLTEVEKEAFARKVKEFSPELKTDLADRLVHLRELDVKVDEVNQPILYKTIEELDALYSVEKKLIPVEFRTEYENAKIELRKNISNEEKRNLQKVISEILRIDWINQRYKEIDVDKAIEHIRKSHIGHERQIDDLRTEILAANNGKKAAKTLNFIGRSCGCGSLARSLAEAIGRPFEAMDFTGRKSVESDKFLGSSRIYSNGLPGLFWEKLAAVGPYGVLIFENVDSYDPIMLDRIVPFIERRVFEDEFMGIPVDLSNLWVILTCSSVEHMPRMLRNKTRELYFEKLREDQVINLINNVLIPKYTNEAGITYTKKLSKDVCKKLYYQISYCDNTRLEMSIRNLITKLLAEGRKEVPELTVESLMPYYLLDSREKDEQGYAIDLAAMEQKFFVHYDQYPESVRQRVFSLLNTIWYGEDENEKIYCNKALRYLVNPMNSHEEKAYIHESVVRYITKTHYGLRYVAEQIDDALLAEELIGGDGQKRMTILGLYGPPGIGKTSIAQACAKALGRGFIKVSFGGASGTAIVKGSNKIVPNAEPSMIMREMARCCGHYSDVILIDEFDKGSEDSYEAFHEFLDPAADAFYDEYLEVNFPKNSFLVILTMNDLSRIPEAILDRMRLIRMDGYTWEEKKHIVKEYIFKRLVEQFGLHDVAMDDEAFDILLKDYSFSMGLRDCERDLEKILLFIIKRDDQKSGLHISKKDVRAALGGKRTRGLNDIGIIEPTAGQALGLAVSGHIGSCIAIQCVENPFQEKPLEVTGLLEGSCRESLTNALSCVTRLLGKKLPKLHIYFLDPSTRKDGASAGLALYMAVISCLLNKKLDGSCCFTGTLDLFGNIGLVRIGEKLTAAEREGIKKVFIPYENYLQLMENIQLERWGVSIIPVSNVEEVLQMLWGGEEDVKRLLRRQYQDSGESI